MKKLKQKFNEWHYIYKEKDEEKKDDLNKDDIKKFDCKKLRLTDDYVYESEKEEKQTDKKPEKKNYLKNEQKMI